MVIVYVIHRNLNKNKNKIGGENEKVFEYNLYIPDHFRNVRHNHKLDKDAHNKGKRGLTRLKVTVRNEKISLHLKYKLQKIVILSKYYLQLAS